MARRHIRILAVTNPAVLEAMRTVPRDRFISEAYRDAAAVKAHLANCGEALGEFLQIAEVLREHGGQNRKDAARRAVELLAEVGIDRAADRARQIEAAVDEVDGRVKLRCRIHRVRARRRE